MLVPYDPSPLLHLGEVHHSRKVLLEIKTLSVFDVMGESKNIRHFAMDEPTRPTENFKLDCRRLGLFLFLF